MRIAVHVTHEAVQKIGGIGSVLNGMCCADSYKNYFEKSVFFGPLFDYTRDVFSRLGPGGTVLYSSVDGYDVGNHGEVLHPIARKHNVDIVFGRRQLVAEFDSSKQATVDVFLMGINRMNPEETAKFKFVLWEKFGLQSELYERDWDYEQYVRTGAPFLAIVEGFYGADAEYTLFAHEYMGVPAVLSSVALGRKHRTVFIGHEVTTARSVTEKIEGHDISFYGILRRAAGNTSLEKVFGSQKLNPRNELVKCAVHFDRVLFVGEQVRDEYRFLVPDAPSAKLRVAFNGVATKHVTPAEKEASRERLRAYIETLYGFAPDVIFTHVTRMVMSKGIWRDVALLEYLDATFHQKKLKGAYILLSTLMGTGRPSEEALRMEQDYGWPVLHREGWPDLIGMEVDIYRFLEVFNAKSRAIKGVFINQFGFDRGRCGFRVPEGADFADLRIGSDVELGMSIYEPFGIAPVETLPFGGMAVLSSVCGCAALAEKAFAGAEQKPYCVVDFIAGGKEKTMPELLNLSRQTRDRIEKQTLALVAPQVFDLAPLTPELRAAYLANAQKHISQMSWDAVVREYLIPNLAT